jgi:1,4-dihydroxy-2-naphthoate polyprenyltransferase
LFYTWPLKHLGLGELSIFLVWGPILAAGVYLVLARGWNGNVWNVALAGVPFGLSVVSINIGKHIDKSDADRQKGVGTLPVRIGERAARYVDMASLILIYIVVLYLIFVPCYFTPAMLIILLAGKRLLLALKVLAKPRPAQPPEGYPAWPTWFSGFNFYHNRLFGGLFILGLVVDTLLRIFMQNFWPMR